MNLTGIARLYLPGGDFAGPFSGDKILWHTDRLTQLRDGLEPPAPVTLELDVTNLCNLYCAYCTNAAYNEECQEFLTTETVLRVLDDLVRLHTKAVTFTGGGEPLCHHNIDDLLYQAHIRGLDVGLITNGVLINTARVQMHNFMRCQWIRVSLDAHDEESYNHSKGAAQFERVLENIRQLAEMKRGWQNTTGFDGPTIGVGYLTYPDNYRFIPEAARLVAQTDADYMQFRPLTFMPNDPRVDEYQGSEDIMPYLEEAKQYGTETYQIRASMPKYRDLQVEERGYDFCSGVYVSCVVGATGDVWICCHMRGYLKFSLGNVKERRLYDIWHDVEMRNEVYARIGDFGDCMPLCRFHGQNKLTANINWEPEHINFL